MLAETQHCSALAAAAASITGASTTALEQTELRKRGNIAAQHSIAKRIFHSSRYHLQSVIIITLILMLTPLLGKDVLLLRGREMAF